MAHEGILFRHGPGRKYSACREGRLDPTDLTKSLRDLDNLYQNAGFNDKAKFGLLSQACMNVPDLVQLTIFKAPENYEDLKNMVRTYVRGSENCPRTPVFAFQPSASRFAASSSEAPQEAKIPAPWNHLLERSRIWKIR